MAALPYIQLYVADYLADTMHLDAEEHGAYLLLIMNYWQTGKPIPKSRLQKIARVSNERWTSVERSLSEFFNETDGCWVHGRIERDLDSVHQAQEQKSAAGKASAQARMNKKATTVQRPFNDRSTTVEIPLNGKSTNKDTDTDTDNASSSEEAHQEPLISSPTDKTTKPPVLISTTRRKKGNRLPEDWVLPKPWGEWALSERRDWREEDVRRCADSFRDYWIAKSQGATKLDWEATWRNWVRNDRSHRTRYPPASQNGLSYAGQQTAEAAARFLERDGGDP